MHLRTYEKKIKDAIREKLNPWLINMSSRSQFTKGLAEKNALSQDCIESQIIIHSRWGKLQRIKAKRNVHRSDGVIDRTKPNPLLGC